MALVAWAIAGVVLLVVRDGSSRPPEAVALDLDEDAAKGPAPRVAGDAGALPPPVADVREVAPEASGPRLAIAELPASDEVRRFWHRYLAPLSARLTPRPDPDVATSRLTRAPEELAVAVEVAAAWAADPARVQDASADWTWEPRERLHQAVEGMPRGSEGRRALHAWLADQRALLAAGLVQPGERDLWLAALHAASPLQAPATGGLLDAYLVPDAAGGSAGPVRAFVRTAARETRPSPAGNLVMTTYEPIAWLVLDAFPDEEVLPLVEAVIEVNLRAQLEAGTLPDSLADLVGAYASRQVPSATGGRASTWRAAVRRWVERWPVAFLELPRIASVCQAQGIPISTFFATLGTEQTAEAQAGLVSVMRHARTDDLLPLVPRVLQSFSSDLALLVLRTLFPDADVARSTKRDLMLLALEGPGTSREALSFLPHVVVDLDEALPAIGKLLESSSDSQRQRAADALMALATVPTVRREDVLRHAEVLAASTHAEVRLAVVRHLGQVVKLPADRAAVESLLGRALNDRDPVITRAAADSLGWMAQRDEGLRPIFARHRPHPDRETDELLAAWIEEFGEHDAEVAEEER
ncbi:MAG: HEAT repeat domain-containing protein [Planctomycetota bacterium]